MNGNAPAIRKQVALSVPSGDHVHAPFCMSLAAMAAHTVLQGTPIRIINGRSSIVAHARNECVRGAIAHSCEWMLFLDSDMVFPQNTLMRLMAHGKLIVGATYVRRTAPFNTHGSPASGKSERVSSGLVEMRSMPTGCLLIHMSVYSRLTKPYFRFPFIEGREECTGEDVDFCNRARAAGYTIWLDAGLSQEVGHIGEFIYRIPEDGQAVEMPQERRGIPGAEIQKPVLG